MFLGTTHSSVYIEEEETGGGKSSPEGLLCHGASTSESPPLSPASEERWALPQQVLELLGRNEGSAGYLPCFSVCAKMSLLCWGLFLVSNTLLPPTTCLEKDPAGMFGGRGGGGPGLLFLVQPLTRKGGALHRGTSHVIPQPQFPHLRM